MKVMTMNEISYMIFSCVVGLLLGMVFFGGLWFTVKKAVTAKIPALWFFISFFLRISIVLLVFYYISRGGWQSLIVCAIGFFIARFVVTYFTKVIDKKQIEEEVYHEA